jgi:predicted Rossmann fold flavoprotein
MRTAIIGGGAAGFFLAINLKKMVPEMDVTIFERSHRVLAKVEISGGGRCNCTNSFAEVRDLSEVYPRGHRLMKRLFNVFDYRKAYEWFEQQGVLLVTQEDQCVFPKAQDSHVIINCFLSLARQYQIQIVTGRKIQHLEEVQDYDYVAVTTGGSPKGEGLKWLSDMGHEIVSPVPSLFTVQIQDSSLTALMGTVVEHVSVMIPSTKFRANGPLLITHWGMSGPAILKLSSYAARHLAEQRYRMPLSVNWVEKTDAEIQAMLYESTARFSAKQLSTLNPFGLPQRLWEYLLMKTLGGRTMRWGELSKKDVNRLVNVLTNDTYQTAGRAPFKDEFVTCGGVSLKSINPSTLESRHVPNLYFAGEVLDIDGITGGFNFQAAWTTAYTVACSITMKVL